MTSLHALAGSWRITRDILHADGTRASFEGEATFTPSGQQLIQDETGRLALGGQSFAASRRYVWREAGDVLEVLFDDLRPFHCISAGAERHEATHLCGPDRYDVAYDFTQWPRWRSVWRVLGPQKDYIMTSDYAPIKLFPSRNTPG
ncbi:trigger factor [Silicimonas algicola]|nr:DUF6314 family protein [Silicimonas algicola]AZQ69688.1 trigger factor [Silicimonas algicola]